jgi:uncharacterized protein with beta-barrel porin domain
MTIHYPWPLRWLAYGVSSLALVAGSAAAQTIDDETSEPVETATADNGAPGDVTITENGSIRIEGGSDITAVTVNSDNQVVNNGVIELQEIDGAIGLLIEGGNAGGYRGLGDILLLEDYQREDTDDDGEVDGPFALGSNRSAVVLRGDEPFVGDLIFEEGTALSVDGNNSFAVRLQSVLEGDLLSDATTTVTGDFSTGFEISADLDGNFLQSGSIQVQGEQARGVRIQGNVSGNVTNEGAVTALGFSSTNRTNFVTEERLTDDTPPLEERIDPDNLLDNGPAFSIGGSVGQGILNNGPVASPSPDEEEEDETKDTIEDFNENRSTGQLNSFGSAPALLVSPDVAPDGQGDVTIGLVTERVRDTLDDDDDDDTNELLASFDLDFGLVNRGTIAADGVNVGFAATGLRLEGSAENDRRTVIEGGIENTGEITARAFEADAVAVSLGAGADASRLVNSGTISAQLVTNSGSSATAVSIEAGAALPSIVNSGLLTATTDEIDAGATVIRDRSGTLVTIRNEGTLQAGVNDDDGDTRDAPDFAGELAIDLSTHTTDQDAVIIQDIREPTFDANDDGTIDEDDVPQPLIDGDIVLGAGDDRVELLAGRVFGDLDLANGSNTLVIENTSVFGDARFGAGLDSMQLVDEASFEGSIVDDSGTLALGVVNSDLSLTNEGTVALSSLDVSGDSELRVNVSTADTTVARLSVSGTATIGAEASILATLEDFERSTRTITLIEAGSLQIAADDLGQVVIGVPAILNQSTFLEGNRLITELAPKTAAELGLNQNASAAFQPLLAVAEANDDVGSALTNFEDEAELSASITNLLPDTSGALSRFLSDGLSLASGTLARRFDQIHGLRPELGRDGRTGVWIDQEWSYFSEDESDGGQGFEGFGVSLQAGGDFELFENFYLGGSGAFRHGQANLEEGTDMTTRTNAFEFGLYGSYAFGNFRFDAYGAGGFADFTSERAVNFDAVSEDYTGDWTGTYFGGSARASYIQRFGSWFVRPVASVDIFDLTEDGYTETVDLGRTVDDAEASDPLLNYTVGDAESSRLASSAILHFGRASEGANANPQRQVRRLTRDTRTIVQHGYVGYRFEADAELYTADLRFARGDEVFTLEDPTAYEDGIIFGAGIDIDGGNYVFTLAYDGEFAGDFMSHGAGASFRVSF